VFVVLIQLVMLALLVKLVLPRFFVLDETASFREFCWLLLVMFIPMVPASFCR
jgi:hypothetical protein